MQAARSHLLNILTNAPMGIITTDLRRHINLLNPAAQRMHRLTSADVVKGQSILSLVQETERACRILDQVESEAINRAEIPYTLAARNGGQPTTYIEATVTLLRDDHYVPMGLLFMCNDVTDKRLLHEALRKQDQLAVVAQMVTTLQHQVNNPLQSVIGNVEMLLHEPELSPKVVERLQNILEAGVRIANLIERMSRMTEVRTVPYVGEIRMIDVGEDRVEAQ